MGDQWKKLWGNKKRWCSLLLAICILPLKVKATEVKGLADAQVTSDNSHALEIVACIPPDRG